LKKGKVETGRSGHRERIERSIKEEKGGKGMALRLRRYAELDTEKKEKGGE
jgi:hypothetical protein